MKLAKLVKICENYNLKETMSEIIPKNKVYDEKPADYSKDLMDQTDLQNMSNFERTNAYLREYPSFSFEPFLAG